MDVGRLRSGELLAGASAVGLVVVLFVDWFSTGSGWESFGLLRFLLMIQAGLALTLVALTVLARPVAMPVAAAVITVGVSLLALLALLYRVGLDEPGSNRAVEVQLGAYLGLALCAGIGLGAWRTLQDERTDAADSRRQAERVLAVRGAPRPPPPERDPSRPDPGGGEPAPPA